MQIILSENEYNTLIDKKHKLYQLQEALIQAVNIKYSDDGNDLMGIRPSSYDVTIDEDKLLDILASFHNFRHGSK